MPTLLIEVDRIFICPFSQTNSLVVCTLINTTLLKLKMNYKFLSNMKSFYNFHKAILLHFKKVEAST